MSKAEWVIVMILVLVLAGGFLHIVKPPNRAWGPGAVVCTTRNTLASKEPGTFNYLDEVIPVGTELTVLATGNGGWWSNPDGMGKEIHTDAGYIPIEVLELVKPAPEY